MNPEIDISQKLFSVIDMMINLEFSDPETKKENYDLVLGRFVREQLCKLKPTSHIVRDDSLLSVGGHSEIHSIMGVNVVYHEHDWAIILRNRHRHNYLIQGVVSIMQRL